MNPPKNIGASIRNRLLKQALQQQEDFQVLLQRYAIERLLYRISRSEYSEQFVLKGAMVFLTWDNGPRRATRDLDLMGYGDNSTTQLEEVFRLICNLPVEADGLEFMAQTVRASVINEEQKYQGIRMKLRVCISGSRTRSDVQVDIGYGNPITPSALDVDFPTLLDLPKPRIKAYPPETVVAEKFEAIVKHGIENTRLKDFYDLEDISQRFAFQGETLSKAIATTFKSRGRLLPQEVPVALTPKFTTDAEKLRIWREFHKKAKISSEPKSLTQVAENIQQFLMPICFILSTDRVFSERWSPDSKKWTEQAVTQVRIEAKQAEIVERVNQLNEQEFLQLHQNVVKYFTSTPVQPPPLSEQQIVQAEVDQLFHQITNLWEKHTAQTNEVNRLKNHPLRAWNKEYESALNQVEITLQELAQAVAQKDQKERQLEEWTHQANACSCWEREPRTAEMREIAEVLKLPEMQQRLSNIQQAQQGTERQRQQG